MRAPLPKGKEWRPILLLSLLNFILSNGLSTWGVKYISAGLAAIMGAIFPLWLVVIGLFSSKNKMPNKAILGLLLGFSGVCIIFYDHLHDFLQPDFRFGILLSLLATWSWAFATLYTKKQAANFNPYFSLGIQMVISGTILTTTTNCINGLCIFFYLLLICATTFTYRASVYLCLH
jgi:drug/metabolite transporter (DMT)-like permease